MKVALLDVKFINTSKAFYSYIGTLKISSAKYWKYIQGCAKEKNIEFLYQKMEVGEESQKKYEGSDHKWEFGFSEDRSIIQNNYIGGATLRIEKILNSILGLGGKKILIENNDYHKIMILNKSYLLFVTYYPPWLMPSSTLMHFLMGNLYNLSNAKICVNEL
ncbi:hypothetical protein C1645_736946 [Glomus cerebriforme]|uniref:Uncharacterized protein n=1 Tax=Glomus cerebriforme TaxID=658196 RepID=A0A397T5P9_9GLOM|nr:hypothetical protein C1645_736946 [Glomus cerebriforme]